MAKYNRPKQIAAAINLKWDSLDVKSNWSDLENIIRSILSCYHCDMITKERALELIDDVIAASTGRGYELK